MKSTKKIETNKIQLNKEGEVTFFVTLDKPYLGIAKDGTFKDIENFVVFYESKFPNYNLRFLDDLAEDPILHKQITENESMSLDFLNE